MVLQVGRMAAAAAAAAAAWYSMYWKQVLGLLWCWCGSLMRRYMYMYSDRTPWRTCVCIRHGMSRRHVQQVLTDMPALCVLARMCKHHISIMC